MSSLSASQLLDLPPPLAVEELNAEAIIAEIKLALVTLDPELAEALSLESEPIVKLVEVMEFRELLLRQRINESVRAGLLAHAIGSDLDNLGAFFAVSRNVVIAGDASARPPIPAVLEADDDFRVRIMLAIDGFSVAGPVDAYRYHALSASGLVKDVRIYSPMPGIVSVTVMSNDGNGEPSSDLVDLVEVALNADNIRPLTDSVVVMGCVAVNYTVEAVLSVYPGRVPEVVASDAQNALEAYIEEVRLLGYNVPRSGLIRALHQPGVQSVDLVSPAAELVIDPDEVSFCTSVDVSVSGFNV